MPGIEITSVHEGHDVHVLGYAFDAASPRLQAFLAGQAADRVARARRIGTKLADLGVPIDVEAVIADAARACGRTVGRPLLADALVARGPLPVAQGRLRPVPGQRWPGVRRARRGVALRGGRR